MYIYIYPQTCVLLFPGLMSVARVNQERATDVLYIYRYIYIYIERDTPFIPRLME